ncbi:hypothetical protein TRSC58_07188 [Trypanosoma rangeli SC58]|uniref:Uncharacterized protein n=1 Tax=Trypanosoma rangeli SC58 TaxID=429131 RepID=A0A061IVZ5_TRYRA|nr:hypothetical protein TRSC58_07188 [Trypanosoma rangeli SC58]
MMASEVGMRARSAVRTVVRWMALLLLLLQCVGSHPSFTVAGEDKHVVVKIKRYFSLPNSEFIKMYGGFVDHVWSLTSCERKGGLLTADQTPAAHGSITDYLRNVGDTANKQVFTYMGGDATYSFFFEENPTKVCKPGITNTSLNCILEWNEGLFKGTKAKDHGVPFYRGSLHSLAGAGPLNGYDSYWQDGYPAHGQIYLISRLDMIMEGAKATWLDGATFASNNPDTPSEAFGVVCEVQDGISTSTTTMTTTKVPTTTTTLPPKVVVPWAQGARGTSFFLSYCCRLSLRLH